MSKKGTKPKIEDSDVKQPPLIDVEPENAKAICRIARAYKKSQRVIAIARAEGIEHKKKLLEEIEKAGIIPDREGKYTFQVAEATIIVTPRDELVSVTFDGEE